METSGLGYALAAAALFGASTPAAKLLLREVSPLMLSALLYLGAATGLSAYRFFTVSESREAQITRGDIAPLSGIIFFGGILGPIPMLFGLQRSSALTGSLLLNLEGPFTALRLVRRAGLVITSPDQLHAALRAIARPALGDAAVV